MVWYSHLFKSFPQFVMIHTVKGFSIALETEVDVFLEFPCFLCDSVNVGNLLSGSSPGHYRDSLLPCPSASQGGLAAPPLTLQNSSPHLTQAVTRTSPKHLTQPGRSLLLPVAP